jgi:hypothetical protein
MQKYTIGIEWLIIENQLVPEEIQNQSLGSRVNRCKLLGAADGKPVSFSEKNSNVTVRKSANPAPQKNDRDG